MNKIIIAIVIVISILGSVGTAVVINSSLKSKNENTISALSEKKNSLNDEVNQLKSDQDSNKYLPSDLVKNFLNEIKSENNEKAKLYLSKDKQSVDLKEFVAFEKEVMSLNVGDINYSINDEAPVVTVNYSFGDDESFYKEFILLKEDGAWKISETRKGS